MTRYYGYILSDAVFFFVTVHLSCYNHVSYRNVVFFSVIFIVMKLLLHVLRLMDAIRNLERTPFLFLASLSHVAGQEPLFSFLALLVFFLRASSISDIFRKKGLRSDLNFFSSLLWLK